MIVELMLHEAVDSAGNRHEVELESFEDGDFDFDNPYGVD